MATVGKKLRALYSKLANKETVRDLDFFLGKAVLEAESFVAKEFKKVDDFIMDRNSALFHINYPKFKEYFISSEEAAAPFTQLDLSGWKVIKRHEIREIEAHNYFPMYIDHDMTHVKYSVSHERYFPMLFGAARSKNHYRFAMVGALGEGVDTLQYSEESAINRYIHEELKLTLEEGMMYLARLTDQELKDLATKIGIKNEIEEIVDEFAGWKPTKSTKFPGKGASGLNLEEDATEMFNAIRMLHTDPEFLPYYDARKSEPKY